mgnify:CR=1 FL=1
MLLDIDLKRKYFRCKVNNKVSIGQYLLLLLF